MKQNASNRPQISLHPTPMCSIALTALVAFGCLGSSPTVQYYTFETVAGLADDPVTETRPDLAVSIGPVHLPGYLDRQQIVTRPGGSRVQYDEFHRWAGVLDLEISRALADNLRILLTSDRVIAYPTTAPFALDYRVIVEVERFDAAPGGDAVLQARWSIQSGGGGDALAVERSHLSGQTGSSDYSDLAVAHSRLLAELSRAIADRIREIDRDAPNSDGSEATESQ